MHGTAGTTATPLGLAQLNTSREGDRAAPEAFWRLSDAVQAAEQAAGVADELLWDNPLPEAQGSAGALRAAMRELRNSIEDYVSAASGDEDGPEVAA
jgi:hypothetical protein